MNKEYKDMLLFGTVGILIASVIAIIGILIPNIVVKWIVLVLAILLGIFGLLFVIVAIMENNAELKKQGNLVDVVKSSFPRKLKNDNYRREIINRIANNLNKSNAVRLSYQDINYIIVNLKKAQTNLSNQDFKAFEEIYLINTLQKEDKSLDEIDRYHFKQRMGYRRSIESIEEYYDMIRKTVEQYLVVCPIDCFSAFSVEENESILKLIKQVNTDYDMFVKRLREEISSTVNYSLETIKEKLKVLDSDQKERIEIRLDRIEDMRKVNHEATLYLKKNPLDELLQKARLGTITNDKFKEVGLTLLLCKRRQEDTTLEKIQEEIDWIVGMLNYDPNEPFICGTYLINAEGDDFANPKEGNWHKYVTKKIADIQFSEDILQNKLDILYELTEHMYNFIHIYPLCEVEQSDNEKIKETIKKVFEKEYAKLSANRIIDFSEDYDFGLVPEKPIFTKSASGANSYTSKLRTTLNEKLTWKQSGTIKVDNFPSEITVCDAILPSGKTYKTLYFNLYGIENPVIAPKGFKMI